MPSVIGLTETGIFTALVAALGTFGLVNGAGFPIPIIRGQVNRVPEPQSPDYLIMWPLLRTRLATNEDTYYDPTGHPELSTGSITQATEIVIQCDVHGPSSADNAARLATLWRDQFGCAAFQNIPASITPLYADDPKQIPFENGEQQTEERWVVDIHMQANIAVTVSQQFADELQIQIEAVETAFPA